MVKRLQNLQFLSKLNRCLVKVNGLPILDAGQSLNFSKPREKHWTCTKNFEAVQDVSLPIQLAQPRVGLQAANITSSVDAGRTQVDFKLHKYRFQLSK